MFWFKNKHTLNTAAQNSPFYQAHYLLVPVDNTSRMQVFDSFEELVHHITFVDVFQ